MATKEELQIFDAAAYRILNEMGVHIDERECIEYFKDTPVEIDEKELIIKIPEYWAREMINKAPISFILGGRKKENDLPFTSAQREFYACPASGSTKMYLWDENSKKWESKAPGFEDVLRSVKMVDAIDAYDGLYGSIVEDVLSSHQGLPAELHAFYAKLKGTTKNTGAIAITEGEMKEWDYVGKMAAEVQGGLDEVKKHPIVQCLPTCIGPLTTTRQNFWAAIGGAKYHLPTYPYFGGTPPFTAPATAAANVALSLACTHYCIAFSQYLDPGVGTLPWPYAVYTDPRSGQINHTPSPHLVNGLGIQVYQDLYGIPTNVCAYTQTFPLDESGTALMSSALNLSLLGGNMVQLGMAPQAFMWELLPMGEPIIDFIRQILFTMNNDLFPTNDEFLGLDTILETGPKGMFTTKPHTLKWIDPKKGLFWHGKDWTIEHSDQWLAKGAKTWVERSRERLKELDKHEPEPLQKDVDERLQILLKQADEELALF